MKTTVLFLFLYVLPSVMLGQQSMTHTTTAGNISTNSTFLDIPAIKGSPNAVITVSPDADTRLMNPHPLGVWYDGSRWAIFNQDKATMTAGLKFLVKWSMPDANCFYRKASNSNLQDGVLLLDHPSLNNNPGARFSLSQLWNPEGTGGMYNTSEVMSEYDPGSNRWVIMNSNGNAIQPGLAFNVIVQTKSIAMVNKGVINPGAIKGGKVVTSHPLNNRQFRLICTGFSVFTPTKDDLLESDGAGDEVFFTFDILQTEGIRGMKHTESLIPKITESYQLKTNVHGATSKTFLGTATNYIRAGSKSATGGLQQGDHFPANGQFEVNGPIPYNRNNPQSFPLVVWEGTLHADKRIFINISPWEYDDENTRLNAVWPDYAKMQMQAFFKQDSLNLPVINNSDRIMLKTNLMPSSADMLGTQPFWQDYSVTTRDRRLHRRTTREKAPAAQMLCLKLEGIDAKGNPLLADDSFYVGRISGDLFTIVFQNHFNDDASYRMYFKLELVE